VIIDNVKRLRGNSPLAGQGCRHIAHLSSLNGMYMLGRMKGYQQALETWIDL